ncbi:Aldehyde/histidinol dehydrogenase [Apodospora peruviana]|uniref:Aldehyde/histidinol dehydrogenase n=1 Tax=Apodospora peruviana TaxID=516989 RepID=A0AAE0MAR0_9PEZI|nr:Aldehyde/histidinol dehydrogenase [Apodospora peruviana]
MAPSEGEIAALERLEAAAIDGQMENVRHRQMLLHHLHEVLSEEADVICEAIRSANNSREKIKGTSETEYYLAMEAVRHFYGTLDFDRELEDEYRVANGKNNEGRRVGFGMVVIRPTRHTRFYSVVVPLAAAISAGNCVVLEIPEGNDSKVDSILRSTLTKALDYNTFCIVSSVKTLDNSILDSALLVDQTGETESETITRNHLVSSPNARVVAVVDRTANIEKAAEEITRARFRFNGTSPYAPDLVLVNEFVKDKFIEACDRYASMLKEIHWESKYEKDSLSTKMDESEVLSQILENSVTDFGLLNIQDKNSPVMKMKIYGRCLCIATCTGLVDAAFTPDQETPLLAGYFFAELRAAKYLSQHMPCHMACINQIPVQLLLGPAAPTSAISHHSAEDFLYRYNKNMFSQPRPQHIESLPETHQLADRVLTTHTTALLNGVDTRGEIVTLTVNGKDRRLMDVGVTHRDRDINTMRARATMPLKPTGQPRNGELGFFESGFLLGVGIAVLPVLGLMSYIIGRRMLRG